MENKSGIRALSLLSGGLDSQLAICVLRDQGIEVHGLCFESPFFTSAPARAAAAQLKIPLIVQNFTSDIVALLKAPPHGFGACMNPCIDCHARMFRHAGQLMEEKGFHFLSTGEVLNERPKSQNPKSLVIVGRDSGYAEYLLRPLSAKLLPETKPEKMGWVDRSRLLDLQGRSRKPQFALAEKFGLTDYPTPAGGCLLTDPNFCKRLKDLKENEGLDNVHYLRLLKIGRHFRLSPSIKVVVGRNARENGIIERHAEADEIVLKMTNVPGPSAVMPGSATPEQVEMAVSICARYSDATPGSPVPIVKRSSGHDETVTAVAMTQDALNRAKI
jgi:tRNA-uridine 2-sulfurtransferase